MRLQERRPQVGIRLDAFTVAWLSVTIWGGAFNTENFRAGFEAVPVRYREAGAALGFRGIEKKLPLPGPPVSQLTLQDKQTGKVRPQQFRGATPD